MTISLDKRSQSFVEHLVKEGRYSSESAVVREGLRLVEEREAKLQWLRDTISAALAEGGSFTDEEVAAHIDLELAKLAEDAA